LREWVSRDVFGSCGRLTWYEATGAASATLTTHVLLALAVERHGSKEAVERASAAYSPWINLLTTMLDSYVDQPEDRDSGNHSYVGHYPNQQCAVRRIGQLIGRSMREARSLPEGERHAVIVACMVALYLSKESARSEELRLGTHSLVRAGGSLTRVLLPILRAWRFVYSQTSS
jgi:tetraprenyl-beta-curcumene synthase